MNQPKFKFGDRLKRLCSPSKTFIVSSISIYDDSFVYSGEGNSTGSLEYALELYQEPQKKKLYAYDTPAGVIHHFKSEEAGEKFKRVNCVDWNRTPEYDIEFPEVSV